MASEAYIKFDAELKRFAESIEEVEIPTLLKAIGLEVLKRLIMKTPVDTGRARGSWQVGIGADPTTPAGSVDISGAATIASGVSALSSVKANDVLYFNNLVHYITYLDKGSSKQAPQGIVDVTLMEVTQAFGGE